MPDARKVLVAMSGGVDSSVAACLLKEQGYDVIGVFMRLGDMDAEPVDTRQGETPSEEVPTTTPAGDGLSVSQAKSPQDRRTTCRRLPVRARTQTGVTPGQAGRRSCCSVADASDARRVAGELDIPFYALNFEADFASLIDDFADEYAAARTPNPCILCNQRLKFGKLADYANAVGADLIATGHYARIDHTASGPRLLRARYVTKDQSYVLFGIPTDVLRRTLFPLGDLTKDDVRAHARRLGLALHDKPESQDICFAPDHDYARVVRSRHPEAFRPGPIKHVDGRLIGQHEGLPHFTIGQRRGTGVAVGSPVYVAALEPTTNTVIVGPREALLSAEAAAVDVTWLIEPPTAPIRADAKIRYHHAPAPADIVPLPGRRVRVRFDKPQHAVTPGQAVVFYHDDEVIGGGWIRLSTE